MGFRAPLTIPKPNAMSELALELGRELLEARKEITALEERCDSLSRELALARLSLDSFARRS